MSAGCRPNAASAAPRCCRCRPGVGLVAAPAGDRRTSVRRRGLTIRKGSGERTANRSVTVRRRPFRCRCSWPTFVGCWQERSLDLGLALPRQRLPLCHRCYRRRLAGLSGRGGTGRRARFRSWYRKMWGFESLRPHQLPLRAAPRRIADMKVRIQHADCRDVERGPEARLSDHHSRQGHRRARSTRS